MKRTSQRSQRKRRPVPVPIASMGDIAFLLIIFFMILSEFAQPEVEYDAAISEYVEKPEETAALSISIDEEGKLYVDGQEVPNADAIEIQVSAVLRDTVTDEQRHIQLKVDRELPSETYQPVIQAIAEGGGILQMVGELPE